MDKRTQQDCQRILACLDPDPLPVAEIHQRIGLSMPRISALLHTLRGQGLVVSPGCTRNRKGMPVNLWART